ncbi:MAG: hypothetical protein ACYC6B_05400 [Thermoleophilia bacterium]
MKNDWQKKHRTSGLTVATRRTIVEPGHPRLSIRRQCSLIELARASYYRTPARESEENMHLMHLIDEEYIGLYCEVLNEGNAESYGTDVKSSTDDR